jgi:hypothetical protein
VQFFLSVRWIYSVLLNFGMLIVITDIKLDSIVIF